MSDRRRGGLIAVLLCGLCGSLALAGEAKVAAREADVSPGSGYVPVRLDGLANDQLDVSFPSGRISVNGIPFDLVEKPGANNLFLKEAGWSDWKEDPGDFYAQYDNIDSARQDPRRFILQVPAADYSAVYLLATTDDGEQYSPVVSFRIGAIRARGSGGLVAYHDFSAEVPRMARADGGLGIIPTDAGNLFLIRVPLGKAIAQDFQNQWALDVDVTKELRLTVRRPSASRFQIRPLGLPSGVHVFGMTFQRSPIQMEVRGTEPGNVFNEPQSPTFEITLTGMPGGPNRCSLEALATDYYGNTTTTTAQEIALPRTGAARISLPIKVVKRGHHDLAVRLKVNGRTVLTRRTGFALLPPDTRRHHSTAPFGVWDFSGTHFTPNDPDLVGPLYRKAGLRYGMFGFSEEVRERYGVLRGNDTNVVKHAWGTDRDYSNPSDEPIRKMAQSIRENPTATPPKRLLIFHEHWISRGHATRVPDMFTGRPPYTMDEDEKKLFDGYWNYAEVLARAIREEFPQTEIYFGNGFPQLFEDFVRNKFPKELLGSRGNESHSFMRLPEAQPLDYHGINAGLWMDRTILDHYGYQDTPLRQCYEICYPGTNPGQLSLRTHADYYVRHLMHSLAWGIPIIRTNLLADVGNSYYFGLWGSSGLCHRLPDVRPKPAYVACATTTLLLDGATFTRVVPTGSPVVYACEFARKDKTYVTCLWTIRGARPLTISGPRLENAVLTDIMANESKPALSGGSARITVSAAPVFLTTLAPIETISPGPAVMAARPEGESFVVSPLDKMTDWTVETGRSRELEMYNHSCPRRKGNFEYAEVNSFEGEGNALRVKPVLPVEGSQYLPMYSVLAHNTGVEIPGAPAQIGLMVNGNGGWGRVIFELEDASGQRWISIGGERDGSPPAILEDWLGAEEYKKLTSANMSAGNADDSWGRSCINFEGWRYVEFPLPGNYPGEAYHWPYGSQWRHSGDGVVKYPLTFKKLIVTLPEKALRIKDYSPVPRQEIYLKDLTVTYRPPEEAFAAE